MTPMKFDDKEAIYQMIKFGDGNEKFNQKGSIELGLETIPEGQTTFEVEPPLPVEEKEPPKKSAMEQWADIQKGLYDWDLYVI